MSVRSFVDAVEQRIDALHSFVYLRGGEVVAEGWWHPYRPELPHRLFSLSKSFTSTAVGFAVAEGRFSLDDAVTGILGRDGDPRIRVRDLLTMTTGHAEDTAARMIDGSGGDWVGGFLRLPIEHEPGTHFCYNSGATYMLSAIVQHTTGETLLDHLRPRLFEPLNFGPVEWETCPRGINTGGWGLSLRTADIARFGLLYLRDGEGILPPGWVREATARHVPNPGPNVDWQQGYGYQFWRCRHDAYRADGAFGQFCVVMPEHDAVLAVTAGVADMQAVLDLVWEHLLDDTTPPGAFRRDLRLPAIHGGAGGSAGTYLVADPRTSRPEDWRPSHERPPSIRAMTFDEGKVTIEDETGAHEYVCVPGGWHTDGDVASTGAWTAQDTFTLRLCWVRTPFIRTFVCTFDGDDLTVVPTDNVSFGPTGYPTVHAKRGAGR